MLIENAMEVEGPWREVFEGTGREGSGSADGQEVTPGLALSPPAPEAPPMRKSMPVSINHNRSKREETQATSLPSIPNPFPELCSPAHSPVLVGSPLGQSRPPSSGTHVVKVFGEDGRSRSLWVPAGATARDVCHMLVQTAHCADQESWALIELHPALGLERCLEDHETVVEVQATWPLEGDNKLIFRKNYAKYEFFKKPVLFFPEHMISDSADVTKGMTSSELIQNLLNSGSCPEIQGFLHVRELSRKPWKRVCFFLRRSGLYCSTKGSSKEPRHLQCVADLEDLNIYTVANSRKLYGAPSDFTFCIKPSKNRVRSRDMKLLCAENEQTRTCWTTAFRLFKYGKQLQCNYQLSQSTRKQEVTLRQGAKRCVSEASLVAMDFSGKAGGRVIENPREAQCAEQEEGQTWRKKTALRYSLPNSLPNSCQGFRNTSIHQTQPWFHGGVSRREAQALIEEQGLVDGMFLIRESQQHAQCFVLSLCYKLKTKHYLVIPCEDDGRKYYTMDDGVTLFIDLLQLVEFHQINRGILPVCLKHPCVRVAL
ncbi:growth factor receptor-bound protein 7 isoform X2 [Anguilla rostrata]|uniref:growth factor receptor-bound protein 7 isoform X2 n=1 Tax=Anguilla anguilla TaxID=7936 RepID=UPI0015B1BD03|nr:growth factor receptor-bound protein 7 isoform X2 [Anguilla anguilla]XP_035260090.1 growth factor receptor-bound protein 7 isoform X2 [Anguilla anguilla]